jgi:hypothetical protein
MTMASKKHERIPSAKGSQPDPKQYQRFLDAARELGCDPADPRIPDVLRGMAAHPHQPRRKGVGKGKSKSATGES